MSSDHEAFPPLRNVEFFPVQAEDGVHLAVRDPLAYMEQVLVLSPLACFIAAHLDGKNGIAEIQASFARQFDQRILPSESIREVVRSMDENFLLENERFRSQMRQVLEEFHKSPVRPEAHSAGVYAEDAAGLRKQLEGYATRPGGPGSMELPSAQGDVVGLVSPHIDFHRGGPGYAWAYREISSRKMADLYVILGVAHVSPPTPFVLTGKSYATPLGIAETERELVSDLTKDLDWNPFEYEIVHRKEHSIEFQAVYLRYCAQRRGENFKALPILVSGLAGGEDPKDPESEAPRTQAFLKALAARLKTYPGKVCLVAGVDLSHIGRRFGDDFDITPDRLAWMEKGDRAGLEFILKKDAGGWYGSTSPKGHNERKVCGLGALYAFSWLMRELYPDSQGDLLHYGHAPDPSGGEVAFASVSFVQRANASR